MGQMIKTSLDRSIDDLMGLLPRLRALEPALQRLGDALMACWTAGDKVLIAGNGGSAADAMHFAEELVVRFRVNRKALAALALCDPTVLTCTANDFCYEEVFSRQVEALGRRGDVFIAMTTSGNSVNLVRALKAAREREMLTVGFLGKDGGAARGLCDVELLVPSGDTARIQEAHKLLFHTLCDWVDGKVGGGE